MSRTHILTFNQPGSLDSPFRCAGCAASALPGTDKSRKQNTNTSTAQTGRRLRTSPPSWSMSSSGGRRHASSGWSSSPWSSQRRTGTVFTTGKHKKEMKINQSSCKSKSLYKVDGHWWEGEGRQPLRRQERGGDPH